MSQAIIIFESEASAIKAKRLLRSGGISAKMTGVTDQRDGCKRGLIISAESLTNAVRTLRDQGIEYTLGKI